MGDGHHGWASAELVHLIRNLCLLEEGDRLSLFPVIPQHWLDAGAVTTIRNAPTRFGPVDLDLESQGDSVRCSFRPNFHTAPSRGVEFNLPVRFENLRVNGNQVSGPGRSFTVPAGTLDIVARF